MAAAQFQGFAEELHTEAAIRFGSFAQPANERVASAISSGLQTARELDRANAHHGSLKSDFGRFGIVLWDEMDKADPETPARRDHLHWFNMARNALAHDDRAKLAKVLAAGYEVDLEWVGRWRRALDGLAGTMDTVVATHLARLFHVESPWSQDGRLPPRRSSPGPMGPG